MGKMVKNLTIVYDQITDILEGLIQDYHFDNVESIIETIMAKEYCHMQEHDYYERLLQLCKDFEDEHNEYELESICKEIMKE